MVVRSPYPDVAIPDIAFTPFVLGKADLHPDRPALIEGLSGRTLTYGQLVETVGKVAADLQERGLGKGDVFGIFCPNSPEFAAAFHGVAFAGGINTTINSLYTADEAAYQLQDSGARFLLTVPPFMDRAAPAAEKAGLEEIFVLGEAEGATPFAELLQSDGTPSKVEV